MYNRAALNDRKVHVEFTCRSIIYIVIIIINENKRETFFLFSFKFIKRLSLTCTVVSGVIMRRYGHVIDRLVIWKI